MVAFAPTLSPRRAAVTRPSPAAAVQKTYVYGNSIDEVIQIRDHRPTAGPTDQYAHQDDLFSVVALTDANGDVTERFRYGDYGNREALTAAGLPSGSTELRHGFTGRLHDELVGLIEYRHRWMQPGTGTFVQRDPLGYVDGMNLLRYALSNPTLHTDEYGLSCNSDQGAPLLTCLIDRLERAVRPRIIQRCLAAFPQLDPAGGNDCTGMQTDFVVDQGLQDWWGPGWNLAYLGRVTLCREKGNSMRAKHLQTHSLDEYEANRRAHCYVSCCLSKIYDNETALELLSLRECCTIIKNPGSDAAWRDYYRDWLANSQGLAFGNAGDSCERACRG